VTYTGRGEVVYPCGALGVVLSVDGPTPTQTYMNAHTDLVLCLRAHTLANKQTLVCSGEAGKVPKVLVWSTGERGRGPEVLACLKGFHRDGVAQVAWAVDGELVLTVRHASSLSGAGRPPLGVAAALVYFQPKQTRARGESSIPFVPIPFLRCVPFVR
jgi:hypothetical protein